MMPAKGIVEMSQAIEAAALGEVWPELSAPSSQTAVGGRRMTPERLEEIKNDPGCWCDDAVRDMITAVEQAEAALEKEIEASEFWRVRYEDVEANRDRWMGQFDEAEHRGLAYMEERDRLAARVKLLESDLKNSHACWNAACEDITKYKARVEELAAELSICRGLNQRGTIDRGSFAKYVDMSAEGDVDVPPPAALRPEEEQEPDEPRYVTREMALDAGDPSLEGQRM